MMTHITHVSVMGMWFSMKNMHSSLDSLQGLDGPQRRLNDRPPFGTANLTGLDFYFSLMEKVTDQIVVY